MVCGLSFACESSFDFIKICSPIVIFGLEWAWALGNQNQYLNISFFKRRLVSLRRQVQTGHELVGVYSGVGR